MSITAIYSADEDPRFATARQALQQVLPPTDAADRRSWHESDYNGNAVVVALDVNSPGEGTTVEELVGVAIFDADGLYVQFRSGSDWRITRPIGGRAADPVDRMRDRWKEHPEAETLGQADGFVTHYVTDPENDQFHDLMALSVATGGNSIAVPDESYVVLSLDGATRLVNVLIEPDQALQLAARLEQAARKVQR